MFKIVGHRGAAGCEAENTLSSFQKAIDLGCDRTELDVHLSKDNELIVIHDATLSRTTTSRERVKNKTLAELKQLHCVNGEQLPTLQEVVTFCKNKVSLLIELKAAGTPAAVTALVKENDITDDVIVISFDDTLLKEMEALNPKIKRGLLFGRYSKKIERLIESMPLDYLGPKYSAVTPALVERAHTNSQLVYAYHVNDKKTGERLLALGVDEIGTDFPELFIK